MNGSSKGWRSAPWAAVGLLGLCGAQAACTAELTGQNPTRMDSGGQAGSGGSGPDVTPQGCDGNEVAMPRRLIRLSFNQIATSLRPLFGDAFADKIVTDNLIAPATARTFPPLGDTAEGTAYIDARWQSADAIATAAGKHALDNFATFTGCGAAPTAECATSFLGQLAQKAYRRPLDAAELGNLLTVFTEVTGAGGTVPQGVQSAVAAIFSSPGFLYRTEFGASAGTAPLTAFELASQLSYFLTDGAPDEPLLAAAAKNELSTDEQIGAQVNRLLALPATRKNLEDMVFAAFGIARVDSVVVDGLPADVFNSGVRASMFRESQLFINHVLWNGGKVSDLVTSRKAFVNARLAPLYDVAPPTAGLDADGFGPVDLPENRAGILTSLGFLTSRARPDQQSVVGRGLAVNDSILCQQNPAFPEALSAQIEGVNEMQHDLSERERADYRQTTAPCMGCHVGFDPYGVALENFDVIGRFRTTDPQGRPIDASVKLPPIAGGVTAQNAVEVGQVLASSGAFASCVGTKLITYALAETGVSGRSCASKAVAMKFATTDQSFSALVRAVAVSKALTQRAGG